MRSKPLSPLREREGPVAQQWEGEGSDMATMRTPLSPLALRASSTLSRKGRGAGEAQRTHSAASWNCTPWTSSSEQRCMVGLLRQMALVRKKSPIG